MKRIFASFAAMLSVMLLTTGCIKLNMNLDVAADDTVSGNIVFAISKELADLGGADSAPETDTLLPKSDAVKVTEFDDGKFVGSKYSFAGIPIEKFSEASNDAGQLKIVRDGDQIVVSGELDLSSGTESGEENPLLEGFDLGADIAVVMTLPGEIESSTGEIEGNKITWTGKFGEKLVIAAVTNSPKSAPVQMILIGLAAGVVIAVGIILVLRRRKAAKAPNEVYETGDAQL
jgi:hypothetical protein